MDSSFYPGMSAGSSCICLFLVSHTFTASWPLIPQQGRGEEQSRHESAWRRTIYEGRIGQVLRGWGRGWGEARDAIRLGFSDLNPSVKFSKQRVRCCRPGHCQFSEHLSPRAEEVWRYKSCVGNRRSQALSENPDTFEESNAVGIEESRAWIGSQPLALSL
jgi:hypothetical protein